MLTAGVVCEGMKLGDWVVQPLSHRSTSCEKIHETTVCKTSTRWMQCIVGGAWASCMVHCLGKRLRHQMYTPVFVGHSICAHFEFIVHTFLGISNRWSGIWVGTVGWKMGWDGGVELTCVTGAVVQGCASYCVSRSWNNSWQVSKTSFSFLLVKQGSRTNSKKHVKKILGMQKVHGDL